MSESADLETLLKTALARVKDPRRVWLQASLECASSTEYVRGMVLGGALSPHYLTRTYAVGGLAHRVPYTLWMRGSRVLVSPTLQGAVAGWIPILETLAQSREPLLLLSQRIASPDLLGTFLSNFRQDVLTCCPIEPGSEGLESLKEIARQLDSLDNRPKSMPKASSYLDSGVIPSAALLPHLPKVEVAGVRRGCTVVLPSLSSESNPHLVEIAILHVGGDNADDQQDRLATLNESLRALELSSKPIAAPTMSEPSDSAPSSAPRGDDKVIDLCQEQGAVIVMGPGYAEHWAELKKQGLEALFIPRMRAHEVNLPPVRMPYCQLHFAHVLPRASGGAGPSQHMRLWGERLLGMMSFGDDAPDITFAPGKGERQAILLMTWRRGIESSRCERIARDLEKAYLECGGCF